MFTGTLTIEKLLSAMKRLDASDLHIKIGTPPTYRIAGRLKAVDAPPLGEDETDHLFDSLLKPEQAERFNRNGALDFSYHLPDGDRFRINIFRAGGHLHAAVRRVKAEIPNYADLHLPPIYEKLVSETGEGLVLVVGVTGSGKSSTIAAMIDQINHTQAVNIITIEDPVEYRFGHGKSIVSQREIGIDVESFAVALRSVVRQDPDVIFIGEMRDHETVLAAIQAAETGHLVFATLHTADTMQALGRMLEFFPEHERDFVRSSLSTSLRAICAQRLLPAVSGFEVGVVPATEVLLNNPVMRDRIREGGDEDLPAIIDQSTGEGMHSFTHSLAELVKAEWIDMQTAMDHAPNREALQSKIRGLEVRGASLVGRIRQK
ncbi:MAG: PilT/PilU family type 4a pilus ATPase [Phycisphaeraceae bacterium]|nr:PilT/PilU family type 4a pilus ATPase [Phycisphaeraceae bacterium]MCW5762356.1 PilT/PilU family type 4a pilus ATPase [Phycisphaeraceae bacterium]